METLLQLLASTKVWIESKIPKPLFGNSIRTNRRILEPDILLYLLSLVLPSEDMELYLGVPYVINNLLEIRDKIMSAHLLDERQYPSVPDAF